MPVANYVKKPVAIQAVQFTGGNYGEILDFCYGTPTEAHIHKSEDDTTPRLIISTLEGDHHVSVGDYVIKGVKNECYPCKPDIFELTYDQKSAHHKEDTFLSRMFVEHDELATKATALCRFINSENSKNIAPEHLNVMKEQLEAMNKYLKALKWRIGDVQK